MSEEKKKAEILVYNFKYINGRFANDEDINPFGKACAIKCVDEIIKEWEPIDLIHSFTIIEFWQSVRKEIENL